MSRSTSFRTAIRKQPLASVDYGDEKPSESNSSTTEVSPTRRTKSFRLATRLNPLLTNVLANLSSSSLPDCPSVQNNEECPSSPLDGVFTSDNATFDQRYRSMPVLTKPLSPFTNGSATRSSDKQSTRRSSSSSFNLGNPSRKVIDVKQYFSRNKGNLEDSQNLKQESKSVTAFHDSFLKKSAENSPERSPKIYPRAISLTKPLSVSSVLQSQQKSFIPSEKENEDPWVVNPKASTEDILNTSSTSGVGQYRLKRSPAKKKSHQRSRSVDFEADENTQNFDWIVYANRNSLPLSGLSKGGVSHLDTTIKSSSEDLTSHNRSKSFDDSLSVPDPVLTQNATDPILQSIFTVPDKKSFLRNVNQSQSNSQGSQKFQRSFSSTIPAREADHQSPVTAHSQESPFPLSYIYGAYTTSGTDTVSSCGDSFKSKYFTSPSYCAQTQNTFHNTPLEEDASFLSSLPVIVRKVEPPSHTRISRSYSTPCAHVERVKGARPQSFNINLNDHEKLVAEMEDYMKRSDSNITLSSQQKFPVPNSEDSSKSSNRFSYASTISGSSFESSESLTDNQSSDSIVDSWKHKAHVTENLNRRSGSYDNTVPEVTNASSKDTKSSIWSLNTWFNSPKKEPPPDLQSVLHSGDLGSASIGSRMAHQEPLYAEFPKLSKASPESRSFSNVSVSVRAETLQDEPVNLKQCDSAYSIQSEVDEAGSRDQSKGPNISRADSFYEKRFSMAFNDTEVFRDSAVFCDIDSTELSPEIKYEKESPIRSPVDQKFEREGRKKRLPVKQFVKEIEEQHRSKSTETTKVRHREPGAIIRQRMESLEKQTSRSQSCTRSNSPERELRRSSTPGRSVSSSPSRDFRRSSTPARSITASPIMENEIKRKSLSNWSSVSYGSDQTENTVLDRKTSAKTLNSKQSPMRQPFRTRSISQDRRSSQSISFPLSSEHSLQENTSPHYTGRSFRSRFLSEDCKTSMRFSLPRSSVNASLENISSERFYHRERSAPPFSDHWSSRETGGMKHSVSLGRLDRLSTDIDNLVIMKGWVRQLIEKFQPKLDDV